MGLKLEDIGRLAGVSRSTVSRVINGGAKVRPEVRDRVEAVIRETGYSPNAAARSLVSRRTGVIGLVIPSRVHALFDDPYFGRLIQGITLAGNRAGLVLSLFLFSSDEEERELSPRVVDSGFLDGVLLTATRRDDPLVERLAGSMPLVMVGRPDIDGVSHVDVDNVGGSALAARHLAATGAERIALIGAPLTTTAGVDRLRGFTDGLADCGRELDPRLHVDGQFTQSGGHRAMHELLDAGADAVFAASDTMAIGALRAARERAVRVPHDISIVGFDGFSASEQSDPPLTTVRQPVADTAASAVEMLNGLINETSSGPSSETLPVELVVRSSTATIVPSAHSPRTGGRP